MKESRKKWDALKAEDVTIVELAYVVDELIREVEQLEKDQASADFLTVKELEKKINIPAWTIRKLVREKKLPAYQITGKSLFDYREVIETIKKCKV